MSNNSRNVTIRKKLIEVALPLPEINDASAYDKMPGIGPHPKGIHHWWARLPLPTARAVLFASVVDDPSEHPERWPDDTAQDAERERLFDIIRKMMKKRLHNQPDVYDEAREEMLRHCGKLPRLLDPFAGGGSIPLEANRLGFEAHAGDLNPIAVLLNKCNLELVPRWLGCAPANPKDRSRIGGTEAWNGVNGLAADVRHYGRLIQDVAQQRIGNLYPRVWLPKQYSGSKSNVIAWLWARTVASPNPAVIGAHVPLVRSFVLSSKKANRAWVEPLIDPSTGTYRFTVRTGSGLPPKGTVSRRGGRCLLTGVPLPFPFIRAEGKSGKMNERLMAIVAEGTRGRVYLDPTDEMEEIAQSAVPRWQPETDLPEYALGFRVQPYGMTKHADLFTKRQLVALTTLSDLVLEVRETVLTDALTSGMDAHTPCLAGGGSGAAAYADTVSTFLALALDRCADFNNALCGWSPSNQKVMHLFGRQAIPMVWDFAEANILGDSVGAWSTCCNYVAKCIKVITGGSSRVGQARQIDASSSGGGLQDVMVSTDPPYYDNIGYAVLSDLFYVWLRRSIGNLHPELFGTVLVPKIQELTASPERFDRDKRRAKEHFELGFRKTFTALRAKMDLRFPLTVYYAFKQADQQNGEKDNTSSTIDRTTGWETMLDALVGTGFQITATWPVRASQKWRMRAMGSNTLASYVVLACRPRPADASYADRRSFLAELKRELPKALSYLQQGNIAPVDLAQAALGPGMAIYSRHTQILEADGKRMPVRAALREINRVLDETLAEHEGDLDSNTRFCVAWFEQYGTTERSYGEAEVLITAKNTSYDSLKAAGVIAGGGGKVRLRRRDELDLDWDPASDNRIADWKCVQHLVRAMTAETGGGVSEAARLIIAMGTVRAENTRTLAYRLFTISERRGWTEEALAYNIFVTSWPQIQAEASKFAMGRPVQPELLPRS